MNLAEYTPEQWLATLAGMGEYFLPSEVSVQLLGEAECFNKQWVDNQCVLGVRLQQLEANGLIDWSVGPGDGIKRWTLTDAGRKLLRA